MQIDKHRICMAIYILIHGVISFSFPYISLTHPIGFTLLENKNILPIRSFFALVEMFSSTINIYHPIGEIGGFMKVGYIRVSTAEQNEARQEVLMEQLGVEKVFMDKMSGKSKDRPQLQEMMRFVREGDVVIVESISRFARNTKDLLSLIDELEQKKVSFVSQKENIDTETPSGRFMLTVFAALSQLERETTLLRQSEGIAIAKQEGKYKGRKPIEIDEELFREQYLLWKAGKTQPKYICQKLGISYNTFRRRVGKYEAEHGIKSNHKHR